MIRLSQVTLRRGTKTLLEGADIALNPGDPIHRVGARLVVREVDRGADRHAEHAGNEGLVPLLHHQVLGRDGLDPVAGPAAAPQRPRRPARVSGRQLRGDRRGDGCSLTDITPSATRVTHG